MRRLLFSKAISVMLAGLLLPAAAIAAATVGPVTDAIGVVKIPPGAPLQIGAYMTLSGPDAALGTDEKRAIEIAVADRGGKLLGRAIKLDFEDSLCSAEGGQTAAQKLAANPAEILVLGPSCSSEATPGAPILWKAGIVSIGISTSAPSLTAPTRKPEYDGFARTIFSDIDQGAADAKWLHDVLKVKRIVTIHDGSAYAQQLTAQTAENFRKLGGTVLSEEAVAPTDVDMHPLLTRIETEKPDALYFPIFVAAAAQILRQSGEVPGLKNVAKIGGGALMAPEMIEAAGDSVVGFRIGYPDVSPEAMGKGYPEFVAKYTKTFGQGPISGFHANAYDAAELAFAAIEKVAVTGKDGTIYIGRKALRDAVFASKFDGISGPIDCNRYGQCGRFKPAVYEFTSADPKTFKIGVNPKKIYP
ncbi:MAG TPA: branched-chain amino acid ABC transporter substrate-binding protein [Stellaceae bacterium]|nr:branched-chain amino acid ABC transporter substrate-binding protein [Stellaceae bacterium]